MMDLTRFSEVSTQIRLFHCHQVSAWKINVSFCCLQIQLDAIAYKILEGPCFPNPSQRGGGVIRKADLASSCNFSASFPGISNQSEKSFPWCSVIGPRFGNSKIRTDFAEWLNFELFSEHLGFRVCHYQEEWPLRHSWNIGNTHPGIFRYPKEKLCSLNRSHFHDHNLFLPR